ncbi:MAG: hypothetical protein K2P81_01590 [Bacteriovoracaceae bacterium]|nr:hypothetical protein [Bacteriovoracaceae bacterium]
MRCLIILVFSLLPALSFAQEVRRWYPNKNSFPEGECVRMHAPSDGNNYVEKVKSEECRPEKVSYLWQKNICYEVDSETQGQQFGVRTDGPIPCAPEGSLFAFEDKKRECWLVDPSGGLKFRAKVEMKECMPAKENIIKKFFVNATGLGGECLEVHKTEGPTRWQWRLNTYECKPEKTKFLWRSTGELKGECWELAEDGPQYYSEKVGLDSCRPKAVTYRFERQNEMRGECYEIDYQTKGQNWIKRVEPKFCRPDP